MINGIVGFESTLNKGFDFESVTDFEIKPSETKWSKKETVGHLIDSAINNLQRFTEIQHAEKPYSIRPYNQDELVKAKDYQHKSSQDLIDLLIALNRQILNLMRNQTEATLNYKLVLPNKIQADLRFLMEDYIVHFYHHLNQIDPKWI